MLERCRLIVLDDLILHHVEISDRHFGVKQFDAAEVVVVGMRGNESRHPLSADSALSSLMIASALSSFRSQSTKTRTAR
jgi:hypothetical protein